MDGGFMKGLKSIGLFFALGTLLFLIGFLGGLRFSIRHERKELRLEPEEFGYSEKSGYDEGFERSDGLGHPDDLAPSDGLEYADDLGAPENHREAPAAASEAETNSEAKVDDRIPFAGFLDAASLDRVLGADTEYVVEEMDVLRGSVVETSLRLPEKYIGMDRDAFVQAMATYASSPPLTELERGFIGLEVLSFSRQRVVVQMNYRYVQPGESFYLALVDHQVVVLLEDQRTVYITTGISANMLSDSMREELAQGFIHVENERSLYDFLEAYSS